MAREPEFTVDQVYAAMVKSNIPYAQAEWAMSILLFPDWGDAKRADILMKAKDVRQMDLEEYFLMPED